MSEPIKIIVTAETAAAAQALRDFVNNTAGGLAAVEKAAHGSAAGLASNRMALMEMGHSARSIADGLAAGMSPLRLMMMESPRLMQAMGEASAEFRAKIMSFVPALAGVGVAIAAGAALWHFYGDALTDPTKRARDLADSLEKIPDILKKIEVAQRAGSITPDVAQKYKDMLSGKTPLYNMTTIPDAFGGHAGSIKNGAFGMFGEEFPQLTTDSYSRTRGGNRSPRQLANLKDITTYVAQQMRGTVTMANDDSKPGDIADVELQEQEKQIQRNAEIGAQKEIDRIKDRYEQERKKLSDNRDIEQGSRTWNPQKEKQYQDTLTASRTDETNSIAEITDKIQTEAAKNSIEQQNKLREAGAKDAAQQIKDLEAQITEGEGAEGKKRGANYLVEYTQRAALLTKLFLDGEMAEDEYNDKMIGALKTAREAQKAYNDELQKEAELHRTIARATAEGQLEQIRQNPFLTEQQKTHRSIGPTQELMAANQNEIGSLTNTYNTTTDDAAKLEAQKQIVDLMNQQVQLQGQLNAAQGQTSFIYQFSAMLTKLQSEGGSIQQQTAGIFGSAMQGGINSVSKGLSGLIEGTEKWKKSLLDIGRSTIGELIQGFVHMGVQWVTTHLLMTAASKIFSAAEKTATGTSVSETAMAATTKLGANAAVAGSGAASAVASIPYVGPILAVAAMAAMVADVMQLGSSFAVGGYTGDGGMYDPAGIVHRGEFVFSQAAVNRLGVENLEALHNGTATATPGGLGGTSGAGGVNIKHVVVEGRQDLMNELKKPEAGHIIVTHIRNNRLKAGIKS